MKEAKYKDEDYQLAIQERYGIENNNDLWQAKKYFYNLYQQDNYKAGLYLAKLYEKSGEINFAQEIYDKLLTSESKDMMKEDSSKINEIASFYTKYKKLRLNEKEIWNDDVELKEIQRNDPIHIKKSEALEKKIIKLIDNFNQLEKEINENTNNPEFSEDLKKVLLNKIFYHLAILKLKRVEIYDENIQEFNDLKLSRLINDSKKIEDDIPKYLKKRDELYESAKKDLSRAFVNNYAKAEAELINIEIKQKLKIKPELYNDEIHNLIKDAKILDPQNTNTRLLEIDYLLGIKINKDGNKGNAQKLLQEILEKEPKNPYALRFKQILKQEIIDRLTEAAIDSLDLKIDKLNKKSFFPFLAQRKFADNKKEYLLIIKNFIAARLDKTDSIESANFADLKNIKKELLREDITGEFVKLFEIFNSNKDHAKTKISKVVDEQVSMFSNRIQKDRTFAIANPELERLYQKRIKFKQRLLDGLMTYYERCMALTTEIPAEVPIKLKVDNENNSSALTEARKVMIQGAILNLSAAMFNTTTAIAATVALTSAHFLYKLSGEDQEKALKAGAEKFITIGNSSDFSSPSREEKRNEARKKLEYLCDKIISKYGMQIDKVSPLDQYESCNLTKLADYTLQKMLVRLHESCPSYQQMFINSLKDPKIIASSIFNFKPNTDQDPISVLEDGLINGTCLADSYKINIEVGSAEEWYVGEIYTAPGLSPNGELIYTRADKKPHVYGVIKTSEIPNDYYEVHLNSNEQARIRDSWDKHEALKNAIYKAKGKEQIVEETKTKLEVKNEKDLKQKRKVRRQRDLYMATALFGGASILTSGIVALANALGTSSLIFGTAAVAVGVATTTLVPAVITSAAIIGFCTIYYGMKGAVRKTNELELIENRSDYSKQVIKEELSSIINQSNNYKTPVIEKDRLSSKILAQGKEKKKSFVNTVKASKTGKLALKRSQ